MWNVNFVEMSNLVLVGCGIMNEIPIEPRKLCRLITLNNFSFRNILFSFFDGILWNSLVFDTFSGTMNLEESVRQTKEQWSADPQLKIEREQVIDKYSEIFKLDNIDKLTPEIFKKFLTSLKYKNI